MDDSLTDADNGHVVMNAGDGALPSSVSGANEVLAGIAGLVGGFSWCTKERLDGLLESSSRLLAQVVHLSGQPRGAGVGIAPRLTVAECGADRGRVGGSRSNAGISAGHSVSQERGKAPRQAGCFSPIAPPGSRTAQRPAGQPTPRALPIGRERDIFRRTGAVGM